MFIPEIQCFWSGSAWIQIDLQCYGKARSLSGAAFWGCWTRFLIRIFLQTKSDPEHCGCQHRFHVSDPGEQKTKIRCKNVNFQRPWCSFWKTRGFLQSSEVKIKSFHFSEYTFIQASWSESRYFWSDWGSPTLPCISLFDETCRSLFFPWEGFFYFFILDSDP